jgi:hypothetical protein
VVGVVVGTEVTEEPAPHPSRAKKLNAKKIAASFRTRVQDSVLITHSASIQRRDYASSAVLAHSIAHRGSADQ